MTLPNRRAMHSEHTPSPLHRAHSARGLFAGLFAGAYALLLIDLAVAGQLERDWAVPLLGALIVLLATLAFPAVERRGSRWLTWAYFAVQLPLGAAIFEGGSVLGGTFLLRSPPSAPFTPKAGVRPARCTRMALHTGTVELRDGDDVAAISEPAAQPGEETRIGKDAHWQRDTGREPEFWDRSRGLGLSGRLTTAFVERVKKDAAAKRRRIGPPDLVDAPGQATVAAAAGMVAGVLSLCVPA